MEPWHISRTVWWTEDKMTEHDACLAKIHVMEHELDMNPEYSEHCELCRSKAQDALWNKITMPSRYDPYIEGKLRR